MDIGECRAGFRIYRFFFLLLSRHRSIFGLPMISPKNTWGRLWSIFIIGVDATYTSFIIPVLLAFLGGQRPSQPIAILEFVTGGLQ